MTVLIQEINSLFFLHIYGRDSSIFNICVNHGIRFLFSFENFIASNDTTCKPHCIIHMNEKEKLISFFLNKLQVRFTSMTLPVAVSRLKPTRVIVEIAGIAVYTRNEVEWRTSPPVRVMMRKNQLAGWPNYRSPANCHWQLSSLCCFNHTKKKKRHHETWCLFLCSTIA